MRLIGVLGGTSWQSTIPVYRQLNDEVQRRLGPSRSARIALYSIDYHEIRTSYSDEWARIPSLLLKEARTLLSFQPDCWMIANSTLHKIYDQIAQELPRHPPLFHAIKLACDELVSRGIRRVLLLGTRFTMEDGYYLDPLRAAGLDVAVPAETDRERIGIIQTQIADGGKADSFVPYFSQLLDKWATKGCQAVVLGCTELPLAITQASSRLVIIDPLALQCRACVDYSLGD